MRRVFYAQYSLGVLRADGSQGSDQAAIAGGEAHISAEQGAAAEGRAAMCDKSAEESDPGVEGEGVGGRIGPLSFAVPCVPRAGAQLV